MKDYIKNNISISIIIGFLWIFFLSLSIGYTDLFSEYFMRTVGITISLMVTNASIKMQRAKREKAKQSISLEEDKNIELNGEGTRKKVGNKYVAKYFLKFFSILFGIATILTSILFYIRKLEFSAYYFVGLIFTFSICELVIGSIVGGIISYIKECKKEGFVKTTLYVIFMLIIIALLVYNKNSRWF